jgi:hypothetical protein
MAGCFLQRRNHCLRVGRIDFVRRRLGGICSLKFVDLFFALGVVLVENLVE